MNFINKYGFLSYLLWKSESTFYFCKATLCFWKKVKQITCSITFWAEDIAKNSSGISMKRIMKRLIPIKFRKWLKKNVKTRILSLSPRSTAMNCTLGWVAKLRGRLNKVSFSRFCIAAVRTKKENYIINQWEVNGSNIWHHSPSVVCVQ